LAFLLALAAAAVLLVPAGGRAEDWPPIDPSQLALKTPRVDPDAGAEAIFWRVKVEDELDSGYGKAVRRHALRIKIFNERGKDAQGHVDLVAEDDKTSIWDVAARTIKPDGSILELKGSEVYDRVLVRKGGRKVKAKSFALPGVEVGGIVEYRWNESRTEQLSHYVRLPLQRDIPVWEVRYSIKPLSIPDFGMRFQAFNARLEPPVQEPRGFYTIHRENVPAFRPEPDMPPEDQLRSWILLYYTDDSETNPEAFWKQYGKRVHAEIASDLKPSDDVAAAARQIVGDATTREDKVARLLRFCQTEILDEHDPALTAQARDEMGKRKSHSPRETLRRRLGTRWEVNLLFAALANAAGLEARIALAADGGQIFFDPRFLDPYFLTDSLVALRESDGWRVVDASSRYRAPGTLRWQNEGLSVLVADGKAPALIAAPQSKAEQSTTRRTGKLRLGQDGTLEGEVEIEYAGHSGAERKEDYAAASPEGRVEAVREETTARMKAAEVSEVAVENADGSDKPLLVRYHLRVPGYAQRTGKRLFLQPAVFQYGSEERYPTQERRHPLYFHYPWSEEDRVSIELPAGFELDHPDVPRAVDGGRVASCAVTLKINHTTRTLTYERKFSFGGDGAILMAPADYPRVKQFFDVVHIVGAHTLTLKPAESGS
jgi:hypothetical protein